MGMVVLGCWLTPQQTLRELNVARFMHPTLIWILLVVLAITGYSAVDKIAAGYLPEIGPMMAARYGALEFCFTAPFLWVGLRILLQPIRLPVALREWKWPAVAATLTFVAYWLVLCAYQLTPFASYVVAVRQFGTVLGVIGAVALLREPVRPMRCCAVGLSILGIMLISLSR
jgi:drug/metabolite transporter (DMT)-like permease